MCISRLNQAATDLHKTHRYGIANTGQSASLFTELKNGSYRIEKVGWYSGNLCCWWMRKRC
jgi:hypothetical protein